MGECERSSKPTTRVSEEAEESSSTTSSVSKRMMLEYVCTELPDSGNELQETVSSSPRALPPSADEVEVVTLNSFPAAGISTLEEPSSRIRLRNESVDLEEVLTLNAGGEAGISTLEESSSRFYKSDEPGEFLDLKEARSFETDGSCVANNRLSWERSITESRDARSNCPNEEMKSKLEGEEKRHAEPPPFPSPRRVKIQKPSPVPMRKMLRLSPTQLEELFGYERKQCQAMEEKYNFDFVNEVPLEGRYEWAQTKPRHEVGERESSSR